MTSLAGIPTGSSRSHRLVLVAFLLMILVLAQGCALGGGPRREGGSGLSQAAEESKKKPTEKSKEKPDQKSKEKQKRLQAGRPVEEEDEDEPVVVRETIVIVDGETPPHGPPPEHGFSEPRPRSIYRRFHVGAIGGPGMVTGDNFGGYGGGGLQVGFFPAPRWRADLSLLAIGANFSRTSGLVQSFTNEHELALDVSGRYYLTEEHTFMGAYPILGLRIGSLNWDYARPILIEDNGTRRVASDELVYFSPYAGVGASVIQTRHFHLGAHLIGGGRFHRRYTREGLVNDLFNDGGFLQLMIEAIVPF